MILHYLKVAVRSLMKYKMQTAISIVGLAVGFVCLAFSMIWIRYELTYDDFHRGAERLYVPYQTSGLDLKGFSPRSVFPVGKVIRETFPEVEDAASFSCWTTQAGRTEDERMEVEYIRTDSAFIRMFDIRLLQGSWGFLHKPEEEIALTQEAAQRFFGSIEDVLGKELYLLGKSRKITALLSGWSKHSNFFYEIIEGVPDKANDNWTASGFYSCLRLKEGVDRKVFAEKLKQTNLNPKGIVSVSGLMLERLMDCHYTLFQDTNRIALQYVQLFSVVSMLIIGVALVNFFSMMVTRIRIRRREIGLRVVCGSTTGGLFRLFVSELVLLMLGSGLLGLVFLEVAKEKFQELSAVEGGLYLPALGYFFFLFLVSVLLSVVIIRYYSRKSIMETLHHTIGNVRERMFFQQGSIVIQLTICVGILWGLSVLFLQLNHLSYTDIGFERDGRATFSSDPQEEGVIAQIKQIPYVQEVKELVSLFPRRSMAATLVNAWDGKSENDEPFEMQYIPEGQEFMDFYGLRLIQGTPLSEQTDGHQVLINETAAKRLGWADPVGKYFGYVDPEGRFRRDFTVVGVIKDFHISAPTDPVQPTLLAGYGVGAIRLGRNILLRFDETRTADLHRAVESIMQGLDGHHDFELKTVREAYDEYLTSERSLMKLLAFVSVVCIVISLFGVYSHVTLACERRRKEIAIRKVNGATAWLIMQSFLKQYAWMLLLSCLIAFPVGTLVMRRWLEQYVEQTTINGWLYGLIMVILALFIGLCTGRSVWRAAHENPAEVIKRE
ncbi:ABC transporter permease [Parabacteroides sp. AGMB00274]|uniref:ABC transporter permease n=1 Tax=Parabacteroides faecalis TaxID=2924040 RepID=A0ABT0BY16_9BACT|nr:FtsX-like permease family protein [Parabacteroides faecalis]MCJ2379665.1 ABC transporter permease [Parabacteroides faecalis]